jgi:predicted Fe-S protein YdhL (DUF1289 family)
MYCVGCFRTVDEIGMWVGMNETKQAMTIAQCEIRRVAHLIQQGKNKKENGK